MFTITAMRTSDPTVNVMMMMIRDKNSCSKICLASHDSALSYSRKQFLAKHTNPELRNSNLFSSINCTL